ncbi:MAG: cell division protein FtsH, partial [Tissierella sp.]
NYNGVLSEDLNKNTYLINRSKNILDELYLETINILENNRSKLELLSKALLEKETLLEEDINIIVFGS